MKRISVVCLAVVARCSPRPAGPRVTNERRPRRTAGRPTTTAPTGTSDAKCGDLESPCGRHTARRYTIKADEAGKGADKLYVGVANDRTARSDRASTSRDVRRVGRLHQVVQRPGRHRRPPDRARRPRRQAALRSRRRWPPPAPTSSRWSVADSPRTTVFSGKDGSDFHKCKLIAIPGFAGRRPSCRRQRRGAAAAEPGLREVGAVFLDDFAKLYPEEVEEDRRRLRRGPAVDRASTRTRSRPPPGRGRPR